MMLENLRYNDFLIGLGMDGHENCILIENFDEFFKKQSWFIARKCMLNFNGRVHKILLHSGFMIII